MSILKEKKKIGIIVAVLLILVIAAVLLLGKGEKGNTITYSEATAEKGDISSYYSVDGYITAGKSQTVYSTGVMTVENIYVSVGDEVSEGDMLISYENDDSTTMIQAQASLSSAQMQVNTAKSSLDRITALYEKGGVSTQEYEQAQNSYASAQIQLTQAQASYQSAAERMEDYDVTAKISGTVIAVSVKDGDDLTSGTEVMEIVNYDELEIDITIDEYDMADMKVGQEATITVNSTGEVVKGHVAELSKKATTVNGVSYFSGTVSIDDAPDTLSVGTSVEVIVTTANVSDVLTIPVGAVVYDAEQGTCVRLKGDAEDKLTPVEIGATNGILAEVKSGLSDGDVVMVASYANESDDSDDMMGAGMGGGMPAGGNMPSGGDSDPSAIIPYKNAMKLLGISSITSAEVYYDDVSNSEIVKTALENKLDEIFNYKDDTYTVTSMDSLIETMEEMQTMLTAMLAGIASISLVVGGIGIMNMMLVSVSERTKEIGLRKALGAEPWQIQLQFCVESIFLSAMGGVIGIIIGVLISEIAGLAMGIIFAPSAGAIILGVGFSVGVGVILGWVPEHQSRS